MEKVNFESLLLLLFLIPGFLSIIIYNNLIYLSTALITGFFLVKGVTINDAQGTSQITWEYDRVSIFVTIVLSILLPILMGYLNRYDLPLQFLRKIKVTNRTGRPSIWLDVFYDLKRGIIVHMKDGRRLVGWPQYFSNNIGPGPLYLTHPSWINEQGEYVDLVEVDGVLLVDHTEIAHIEFLNAPQKGGLV